MPAATLTGFPACFEVLAQQLHRFLKMISCSKTYEVIRHVMELVSLDACCSELFISGRNRSPDESE